MSYYKASGNTHANTPATTNTKPTNTQPTNKNKSSKGVSASGLYRNSKRK